MSDRGRSNTLAPWDVIWPGLTSGDCMAMAAIFQSDAARNMAVGGPRDVLAVKQFELMELIMDTARALFRDNDLVITIREAE